MPTTEIDILTVLTDKIGEVIEKVDKINELVNVHRIDLTLIKDMYSRQDIDQKNMILELNRIMDVLWRDNGKAHSSRIRELEIAVRDIKSAKVDGRNYFFAIAAFVFGLIAIILSMADRFFPTH